MGYRSQGTENEVEVNENDLEIVLKSLRMCQILFKGIYKRIEANDKLTIPIISELYKVSVYLENVFDGFDSKITEMGIEFESMKEFLKIGSRDLLRYLRAIYKITLCKSMRLSPSRLSLKESISIIVKAYRTIM